MSVIQTNNLTKVYDEGPIPVHAVNHVTVNIEEGEFTAVVGPSGSGKTTLLNIVGGLDRPTSGSVKVDGVELSSMNESNLIKFRLEHIGFVFQSYNQILTGIWISLHFTYSSWTGFS